MSSILAERELYVDQNEIYRDYISRFEINYNLQRSETPGQWTSRYRGPRARGPLTAATPAARPVGWPQHEKA